MRLFVALAGTTLFVSVFIAKGSNASGTLAARQQGKDPAPLQYSDPSFRGDGKSGIRGLVVAWPISPVSRLGESDSRPLPHAIVMVQPVGGGAEIVRQLADAKGRFQIALASGSYQIIALAPHSDRTMPGAGRPEIVTVPSGKFVDVVVYYDTGIR